MLPQAIHFKEESDTLLALINTNKVSDFSQKTKFKTWSIEDIFMHLHVWNHATLEALENQNNFKIFAKEALNHLHLPAGMRAFERKWYIEKLNGQEGTSVFQAWQEFYPKLSAYYGKYSPDTRVVWAGPDMLVGAKMAARQMETWAHGQAIFDLLNLERQEQDRLKNIAHMGVITFSWAFKNRNITPPSPKPYIRLTAPSGNIWEWNTPQKEHTLHGCAIEFCQVVTQTRHIADTSLQMTGSVAQAWMNIAQCFAGKPESPPEKGSRL